MLVYFAPAATAWSPAVTSLWLLGMPTPLFADACVPGWTSYVSAQICVRSLVDGYTCRSSAPCWAALLGGVGLLNGVPVESTEAGVALPKLPCETVTPSWYERTPWLLTRILSAE